MQRHSIYRGFTIYKEIVMVRYGPHRNPRNKWKKWRAYYGDSTTGDCLDADTLRDIKALVDNCLSIKYSS